MALQGKTILTVRNITVSELSQLQKEKYHLYEAPRIAKFIKKFIEFHRLEMVSGAEFQFL